jgi:hypothetical protein
MLQRSAPKSLHLRHIPFKITHSRVINLHRPMDGSGARLIPTPAPLLSTMVSSLLVAAIYGLQLTYSSLAGSHLVKAGWSFDKKPRFVLPPVMSRYRDRKLGRQAHFIGYDAYVDATTRGQLKNAFDGNSSVVGNWDVMEGVLDYIFLKMGVDGANGGVDRPILMTEPIANLGYPRRSKLVSYIAVK